MAIIAGVTFGIAFSQVNVGAKAQEKKKKKDLVPSWYEFRILGLH